MTDEQNTEPTEEQVEPTEDQLEPAEVQVQADRADQTQVGEPSQDIPERRVEERTKSQVQRTVPATLEFDGEGPISSHLYIQDISKHGLRVHLDRSLEPETQFRLGLSLSILGFGLEGQIDSVCRVAWSRNLKSGTCIVGLQLLEQSEDHLESMGRVIEHWKRKSELNLVRLKDTTVGVKVGLDRKGSWSPVLAGRALSELGVRFHYIDSLPVDENSEVRLLFESRTLQIPVQVRWCESMPSGVYDIGCAFVEVAEGDRELIEQRLRRTD